MSSSHQRFVGRRFFAVFAFLATLAQIVVALAPLAEGRDGRMASHVEANGSATHFTHNDANCAACQARSIQGTAAAASPPLLLTHLAPPTRISDADVVPSFDRFLQDSPRAPPSVI